MDSESEIEKIYALLDCPICFDKLDRFNKVLPCQHTFCGNCIQKTMSNDGGLRCPECRSLYKGKIEDLPSNIFLIRILGELEKMRKISSIENKKEEEYAVLSNESDNVDSARICHSQISSSRVILKPSRRLINYNNPMYEHNMSRPKLKAIRRLK